MIVLDELLGDAEFGVGVATICLVEEAAVVAVDDGVDQDGSLDLGGGFDMLHR
jgi:hypothetical protein